MRTRRGSIRIGLGGLAGLAAALAGVSGAPGSPLPAAVRSPGTAVTAAVTGAASTAAPVSGPMRAAGTVPLPAQGGTVQSLNWSGYAVTPSSKVTAVESSFTVPSAGMLPPGFAATWTGIGGYAPGSTDLIQAGVGEDSLPSLPLIGPQYSAWYEVLPAAETPLTGCTGDPSCTVAPGDHVTVAISEASAGQWAIAMTDTLASGAARWTFAKTVAYASSGSSAEWILEAPQVAGLQTLTAPVGVARFGPTSTFTAGGTTTDLAGGHPTTIVQSLAGLVPEATPSAIAGDGQSFDVCTYATSCPAP